MADPAWEAVDAYVVERLVGRDPVLEDALAAGVAAGLPSIEVSPPQGKLLHLLARAIGARRILEIGTLAGYSTIWLARAVPPGGRVVTLELEADRAEVARATFARARLDAVIDVRAGPALEALPAVAAEDPGSFDLVFIDADKAATPEYFAWAMRLTRPGGLVVADNVVRGGRLADAASEDPAIRGMRRFHDLVAAEPRATATTIQTVGSKGHDGFTLVLVA